MAKFQRVTVPVLHVIGRINLRSKDFTLTNLFFLKFLQS